MRSALDYDNGVFINCPYDSSYQPMFDALAFAVLACGFEPHAAREIVDGSKPRIEIISSLIAGCRLGIHDISRVELSPYRLPRFNMTLELGLFLGASRFGDRRQRLKKCLILDTKPLCYRRFISDIGGQAVEAHGGGISRAIRHVRDFLAAAGPAGGPALPGAMGIATRFDTFRTVLPELCRANGIRRRDLTFGDHARLAARWLYPD